MIDTGAKVFIYIEDAYKSIAVTSMRYITAEVVLRMMSGNRIPFGDIRKMLNRGYIGPMRVEDAQYIQEALRRRGIDDTWLTSLGPSDQSAIAFPENISNILLECFGTEEERAMIERDRAAFAAVSSAR